MFEKIRKRIGRGLAKLGRQIKKNTIKTTKPKRVMPTYVEPAQTKQIKPAQIKPTQIKPTQIKPTQIKPKESYENAKLDFVDIHNSKNRVEIKEGNKTTTVPNVSTSERKMLKDAFLQNYDLENLSNNDKDEIIRYLYDLGYRYTGREQWYSEFGLVESQDSILKGYLEEAEKDDWVDRVNDTIDMWFS